MKTAYLYRSLPSKDGTFGLFTVPFAGWSSYSLENPWLDNIRNESCIPDGEYICRWTKSNRFGCYTYQIMNVPNRTGIRFHPFNFVTETDGCVGLGLSTGYIRLRKCLEDSADATSRMEDLMNREDFKLSIHWVPGMV